MKSDRQNFEAELAAIREELIRLGVQPKESQAEPASTLMTAAYEMAGYVVATLALGRNAPETILLKENNEYDLGKCTEGELHTIWTVGHIAGARGRSKNCPVSKD
jgi:hypothetical protein